MSHDTSNTSDATSAWVTPGPSGSTASRSCPRAHPELLAPAGDWECARAAVENGADAIYFGLEKFNARMRAHNFTEADLPELMEFLHRRGVKGYVTFNTLIFQNEMAEAEQYLRAIIAAGVDAAIVQDVGICRLIRQLSPDFPIHASTQMTITSAAGVAFAHELGCQLVVLARECSIREIEKIRAASEPGGSEPGYAAPPFHSPLATLPLEVFVHGALCVAYSGQCLTSEALGGRSANRGECAQACRMPYELICDGQAVPLRDRKYLLSPQDLAGLAALPELVQAGVSSLKIEGRLKTPEYVANITRIYRQALDDLRSNAGRAEASAAALTTPPARQSQIVNRKSQYDLEMAFSRGLYTGWLRGLNHQQLVHARFGKKRGVYLGEVTGVHDDRVWVKLAGPLKPGDGVVFDAGHPEQEEQGGRVYGIQAVASRHDDRAANRSPHEPRGSRRQKVHSMAGEENQSLLTSAPTSQATVSGSSEMALTFGYGDVDFSCVRVGDKLWKTSDPDLDRRLRQSFEGNQPKFQRPVRMEAHGHGGQPLILRVQDELGHVAQVASNIPLAKAETQPLSTERLRQQLGRLGGTPFRLDELTNLLEGAVILPVSELNRLRREAVRQLELRRAQPKRWTLEEGKRQKAEGRKTTAPSGVAQGEVRRPHLIVLVRSLEQLDAALSCGVATLYCEFEDPKKYREAVARTRAHHASRVTRHAEIWVAPPRIFKTGEEWTLQQVRSCDADGYLVRNYDHLPYFANGRRIGDFSLNVANALSADYFRNKFGLERVTASYDLNFTQLEALLRAAPPEWFEVTLHQHVPMFHMEHCVFCAFLSKGTDYTNCGRPCDKHEVKLRDRVGAEHVLKADVGCRNTVFNARAQTGAEYVERMRALGVQHFRIEFVNETPDQVKQTVAKYRQLLSGELTGTQLWRELKLLSQLGVTRGPFQGDRQ